MRPLVLGTAGHIDHGKTALVRALTGTDTDRLPDEKRRGITIDLGFASLTLPDGMRLSIVDVPGHEAFVRNMLAGATGIDVVLLVVAADEGPMPQTREHLAILGLLGVTRGLVALTKIDLVEAEWLELVREELAEMLSSTALAGAPIIDVSVRSGAGLESLTQAIAAVAGDVPAAQHVDLFRMPIDRVFTIRGTGTVVTGTVWSGSLRRDAQVSILPSGVHARVRGLQQHGAASDEVVAGARAAIAIAGVERDAIARGDTLVTGDGWHPAGVLTVRLTNLADATAPIRPRQRVRVHVGTAEVLGRLALLDRELAPGDSAIVQLRLEQPIVARAGDHLVIRSWSPVHTIGGGIVLEPAAPKRKRLTQASRGALEVLARELSREDVPEPNALISAAVTLAGPAGLEPRALAVATGLRPEQASTAIEASVDVELTGGRLVAADLLRETRSAILAAAAAFHREKPMLDGVEKTAVRRELGEPPLFDAAVAALLDEGRLVATGNSLALPNHAPALTPDAEAALARLEQIYAAARLEPPELAELPPELVERTDLPVLIRFLERDGTLLRMSPARLISARAVSETVVSLRGQLRQGPPLGIADFKDVLKLTRKHLIPLLEYFDRTGVTRREGEARVLVDG